MNYKVTLEFDAFDCESPEEAAKQIETHLQEAFDRFVYIVIDANGKETIVDREVEIDYTGE